MKRLQDFNYEELVANGMADEYWDFNSEGQKTIYRYLGTNGKFAYLTDKDGNIKAYENPKWTKYFIKINAEERRLAQKKKEDELNTPRRFDSIDKANIKKGAQSYEGDLEKDLLQPLTADGKVNPKFVKAYGEEPLKHAVRKPKKR